MDEGSKIVRKGTGLWMILVGILSFLYLLNPTFGFFELIPDNTPVIGNLDEAAATAILIGAISYFRKRKKTKTEPESEGERKVEAKVVEVETDIR